MLLILKKKITLVLLLLTVILSSMMVVSANDDNATFIEPNDELNINEIYVSPDGSDKEGIGSSDSPFQSISHAVDMAGNNSKIILKDGTYIGSSNTNININKYLTIETQGDVTLNGEGKNYFFKVNKDSSLILNNIKFINGYTDSYSQLGAIKNQGKLLVNNTSFSKMDTVMSTFYNEGELIIDNSIILNSKSKNIAKSITNLGDCTISNSKLNDATASDSDLPNVYNFKNIDIIESQISHLKSNDEYDASSYQTSIILIKNSTLTLIEAEKADIKLLNSNINRRFSFNGCNVYVENSKIIPSSGLFNTLSIFKSNFTAINTIFDAPISSGHTDFNITYSSILHGILGGGDKSVLYAPYNWWGVNSGPEIEYFKNIDIRNWAIASFEIEDGNNSIGTTSKFITSFKWFDGNNSFDLKENESIPTRPVHFEAQNGRFLYTTGSLTKSFENYLIGNTLDCSVYSTVDNQKLTLTIGNGYSAYNYFVAPWGEDRPEAGSSENPYRTLGYAISKAVDGNTICLLEGIYNGSENSKISISKNLTIIGLGNVNFLRVSGASIMTVRELGNVIVKNINFGCEVREYNDNLFTVTGGTLTIENCTFSAISSASVIYTSPGVSNNGLIQIRDSEFSDIKGSVVSGPAKVNVDNCSFEKISNFYSVAGMENYNALFTVTSSIEIYNSEFTNNTMGIITLHPYTYSGSGLLGASNSQYSNQNRYAYIENSTFTNNLFTNMGNSYSTIGIGFDIADSYGTFYGYINKCTFKDNTGKIAKATSVNSSSFYNNHGLDYGGRALIEAELINNSVFISNLNRYTDYSQASYGEGIASAQTITYSTFINNEASFGGAVSNSKEVHYCVFVNNTALYSGNDIYSNSGDVDYSSNWWGDNKKPDDSKIFIFLGNLKLTDWVIMTFESYHENTVEASLDNLIDDDGNIKKIGKILPSRPVYFAIDLGNITPSFDYLKRNVAYANVSYDLNSSDFKVYATIDNQVLDLNLRNTNTMILIENVTVKGNDNKYYIDLINANGFKIANQTLTVQIINSNNESKVFTIKTDENGRGSFDIDYPTGKYEVLVNYYGNGYYEKSSALAKIEIVTSFTEVISYNYTYFGKNNVFYGILKDENGKNLVNYNLTFTIISANGEKRTVTSNTDYYGRSEIILNLAVGEYDIKVEYPGDSWYAYSSSYSHIIIKPVNSTITVPDVTLYGEGNLYNITLKDSYGTLIRGENIQVAISQANKTDNFILQTNENGIASLTVNYMPGTYNVKATYKGDDIYGSAEDSGKITVNKVLTIVSGFHHKIIPLNGLYTVVLSDMYGKRINNGTVTLNCYQGKLVKTYTNTTDPNGEASFIIDLAEGTYLTTIDYDGSLWYSDATNAATIVVDKNAVLESVRLNGTDLVQYYGENKFFAIDFNDPNAYDQYGKTITVSISNEKWSQSFEAVTDAFGTARLQIKLNPGEYNVTYKYSNQYYNIYGSGSNKITVYKMPVTLTSNDLIMNVNDQRLFEATLKDTNGKAISNMQIHVKLNGKEYDITTNDKGVASLPLNLNIGEYEIEYSLTHPNYIYSSNTNKILVVDTKQTSTQIIAEDITEDENNLINFTLTLTDCLHNGISYSEVTLEIIDMEGKTIKKITDVSDANGNVIFKFTLDYGRYTLKSDFKGNDLYLASSSINIANIKTSDNRTKTVIYTGDVQISANDTFNIVLCDENGKLLSNKEITFIFKNMTYSTKTNSKGEAFVKADVASGIHNINVVFNGDDNLRPSFNKVKLYVSNLSTKIYAPSLVKYYRNSTQFHALLTRDSGRPLANQIISVILDNAIYNCTTDENGWITLDINLKPGHYDVECHFANESSEEYSFNKTTIDVLTTILGQDEVKIYGDNPYLTIKFLDGVGNGIKNKDFVIGIDGTNYFATTNDEGIFYFDLNLNAGNHVISVINPFDGLSESYKLTIKPTVIVNNLIKVLGDGQYYTATFYDKNNSPVTNKNVNVIINGINHTYKTDSNGKIKLSMEFNPDSYLVTAINPITGEYVENTVKVLSPISENKDLTIYFTSGSKFKVRIIAAGGKAVGAGKTVKFKINGKTYTSKTNKNGYASLKINLKAKKYTVTTQYGKYKATNKITVKPLLTAKNISKKNVKKVTFKAKLVTNKGKVAKNKKITFKFKNNKYTAKTNSKGIATIKLTLSPGKYKIQSIYGKSKITNTITIKK